LGGAGSLDDIREVIEKFEIIGVVAGGLYVFRDK
jgi:cyclase